MRRAATRALPLLALVACAPDDGSREGRTRDPASGDTLLVVAVDGLRSDHLAPFGYALDPMPRLSALAAQGLVVPAHATVSTATNAALASLLTGLQARDHGVGSLAERGLARLAPSRVTLAEVLSDAGYRCLGLVSRPQLEAELSGLDQGFERWLAPGFAEPDRTATQSVWNARGELVALLRGEGPVFVLAHFADPTRAHALPGDGVAFLEAHLGPFRARQPLLAAALDRVADDPDDALQRLDELLARGRGSPEHAAWRAALYDGQLAHVDRALGELLDLLEEHGRAERALVVVVGTRGAALGAGAQTGPVFERGTLGTPLVLRFPGAWPVGTVEGLARLVDVAPTAAQWAGAAPLGGEGLLGRIAGRAPPPAVAFCEDAAFAHRTAFDERLSVERGPLGLATFDRAGLPVRAPASPDLAAREARLRAALEEFDRPWAWRVERGGGGDPIEVLWRVADGVARAVRLEGGAELGIGAAPVRGRGVAGRARLDARGELEVVAARRSLALRLDVTSRAELDEQRVLVGATPLARSLLPRLAVPSDAAPDPTRPGRLVLERAGGTWQRVTVGPDEAAGPPVELVVCLHPPGELDRALAWAAGAEVEVLPFPGRLDALRARGRAPLELQLDCPPGRELALAARLGGAVVPLAEMRAGGQAFAAPGRLALYLPDWLEGITDELEERAAAPLGAGELRLSRTPFVVPPAERTGLPPDALRFVRELPGRE